MHIAIRYRLSAVSYLIHYLLIFVKQPNVKNKIEKYTVKYNQDYSDHLSN